MDLKEAKELTETAVADAALKLLFRPLVFKLLMDTPAWYLATLLFLQFVVAVCDPWLGEVVMEALPAILGTVVAYLMTVFWHEHNRRSSFESW